MSNLIQNDPSTRRLLQGKNIVGALITRLSDTVEEVVVEGAGALRYGTVAFPLFFFCIFGTKFNHLLAVWHGISFCLGTFALMEVMTFAPKCITKIS